MKSLTVGESLRVLMKREGIKQVELAEKLGIDKRNISQTLKKLDENKGNINTLMEYADIMGYEVEIGFKKKKEN